MATDREKTSNITIITRVTYSKPGPDLLQRTKVKIKDMDDVVHVISDIEENVGKRSLFKKDLKQERDNLESTRARILEQYDPQIEFLTEQIADIDAL